MSLKQLPSKISPQTVPHLVVSSGTQAMGDTIARMAVLPEIFNEAPHVRRVHFLVPEYLVEFAQTCLKMYPITIHSLNHKLPDYLNGAPFFTFDSTELTTLRMGLVEHAYMLLTQKVLTKKVYYPAPQPIAHRFALGPRVITACIDFTAAVRAFPNGVLNQIADKVNVPIVLLGNSKNVPFTYQPQVAHPLIIDLRDQTTPSEAHSLIANSKAFFGVDNGLVHLAGCTSTPIVAAYTSVDPATRVPPRLNGKTVILEPKSDCRYCQSSTHFNYGHDYRNCAIVYPKCVTALTAARWIEAIRSIDADLLI